MSHNPSRPSMFPFQAQAELELLQLMLQSDEPSQAGGAASRQAVDAGAYPWNPALPAAEAYFDALEQEVIKAGWSSEELAEQGQRLANSLSQLWVDAAPAECLNPYSAVLRQFAAQVPPQILETIAQKAQQVVATNLTLADQIVQCVQACLPQWGEEDLQVLARPLAYAMRGAEPDLLESVRSVRSAPWTELSGIEQARLTLAIARYTIAQTPDQTPDQLSDQPASPEA